MANYAHCCFGQTGMPGLDLARNMPAFQLDVLDPLGNDDQKEDQNAQSTIHLSESLVALDIDHRDRLLLEAWYLNQYDGGMEVDQNLEEHLNQCWDQTQKYERVLLLD